jgi:hypothetical protein
MSALCPSSSACVMGMEIRDGTPEIMWGVVAREVFERAFNSLR